MCESYPAALINNPVSKTVLKVVECHLFNLPRHCSAHAGHLHGGLSQPEHASNCLPASVTADVVTDQLLKPTHVAVAGVLHQFSHDWRSNYFKRLLDKTRHPNCTTCKATNVTSMTIS